MSPEDRVGHNAAGMCGRFALYTPPARIARYFGATLAEDTEQEYTAQLERRPHRPGPRGEGAAAATGSGGRGRWPPRRTAARRQPERLLMSFRWGLVPWWSKDAKAGSRLFNARSETVTTKASFREAFRERRIIVPADGFYEWRKTKTGARQPHYFTRADGAPMAFAGLAERWRPKDAPKDTPYLRSCTMITAPGGADMEGIHDRMPVILDPATFDLWLDPTNEDSEELRALLRPPPGGTVVHHLVGPRIGNVRNNDPSLIESV